MSCAQPLARRRSRGCRHFRKLNSTCTASISAIRRASSIWLTGDVAQADVARPAHRACSDASAHAGRERRARVRRVELIERDALDLERRAGWPRRRRRRWRARPSAAQRALGRDETALGGDDDAGSGRPFQRARARERSAARCASVSRRVEAIGIGGVEKVDAGVEAPHAGPRRCRAPRRGRARGRARLHAAEPDHRQDLGLHAVARY